MNPGRQVRFFCNSRNQAVRIPREFELDTDEALIRREDDRLVIEPIRKKGLLATLRALDEGFPDIDKAVLPLDDVGLRPGCAAICWTPTSCLTLCVIHKAAGLQQALRKWASNPTRNARCARCLSRCCRPTFYRLDVPRMVEYARHDDSARGIQKVKQDVGRLRWKTAQTSRQLWSGTPHHGLFR